MKKRVKVIMLPTEDSTSIIKLATSSTLYYYSSPTSAATKYSYANQHLYFISDEKLIDGEWCYESKMKGNKIFEYDSSNIWHKGAYKVVATTDKSLVFISNNGRIEYNLPQIPQEFIENYCRVGGIDEVEIEYYKYAEELNGVSLIPRDLYRIKIDPNNCTMIHPTKDSWSRQEVKKLIESAVHDFAGMNTYDYDNLTEWINKNL